MQSSRIQEENVSNGGRNAINKTKQTAFIDLFIPSQLVFPTGFIKPHVISNSTSFLLHQELYRKGTSMEGAAKEVLSHVFLSLQMRPSVITCVSSSRKPSCTSVVHRSRSPGHSHTPAHELTLQTVPP